MGRWVGEPACGFVRTVVETSTAAASRLLAMAAVDDEMKMTQTKTPLEWLRSVPPQARALFGLCVATVGWGGFFIVGKVVLDEMSPLVTAAWRYAASSLVVIPFALGWWKAVRIRPFALDLTVMTLCGGVLYPWLILMALQRTSATNTSLLVALMPVIALVLARFLGEKIGLRRWFGVFLALSGAAIVITRGELGELAHLSRLNRGDLIALLCAMIWATFNIASRRVAVRLPATVVGSFVYGGGGLVLLALAMPEQPVTQLTSASPAAVGCLLAMGFVSSAFSGQCYLYGIRVLGVSRAVLFVYLVPVTTAGLAWLFFGETVSTAHAAGGVAVLGGLVLGSAGAPAAPAAPTREATESVAVACDADRARAAA